MVDELAPTPLRHGSTIAEAMRAEDERLRRRLVHISRPLRMSLAEAIALSLRMKHPARIPVTIPDTPTKD